MVLVSWWLAGVNQTKHENSEDEDGTRDDVSDALHLRDGFEED